MPKPVNSSRTARRCFTHKIEDGSFHDIHGTSSADHGKFQAYNAYQCGQSWLQLRARDGDGYVEGK